jgi:NADH:ubiquinone oxidoreductase subunit 3 (subunit A)
MSNVIVLCVIVGLVAFCLIALPYIVKYIRAKKKNKKKETEPLFEKGDIITFEHCYNNPFGNKLFYLVLDVKLGYNGSWYYKYVKCDHTGVVKPHAVYETDVIFPNTFVKVGFIALS